MRKERVFPWGRDGFVELKLPGDWPEARSHEPDLSEPVDDYEAALDAALGSPLESKPIESLVRSGDRVAIVVDDPSRWTPVKRALPAVLSRLHARGVPEGDICVCVGVGRHRAVDDAGMRARMGEEVVAKYACHSPPVDDRSAYVELGATPQGVPVRVFRPVVEARVRVLIGSVLPHLQAGFGGGHKLIFPGCSHRSTLGALHRQGFGDDPHSAARLLGGNVRENAMRAAIRAAAALLPGVNFSIGHVMGRSDEVLRIATGDVDAVQSSLSEEARRRFVAAVAEPADVVIAGNAPFPGDPLMSFKVLLNHRLAARPGGVLVGLFWTDPHELDRSLPSGVLRTIAAGGAVGGWLIRRAMRWAEGLLAAFKHPSRFMLRWGRELVGDHRVLVYAPELAARFGRNLGPVRLFGSISELWDEARAYLRRVPQDVHVFPFGGLTYVPIR